MIELMNVYLWIFLALAVAAVAIRAYCGLTNHQSLAPHCPIRRALGNRTEPPKGPSVLVVDDSAVARRKLQQLLEGGGFEVTVANHGADALARLAERPFDLLITDLEMPQMDGFSLIRSVKSSTQTSELPILAVTGHDELHAQIHLCQGVNGFFHKPWDDAELLRQARFLTRLARARGDGGPLGAQRLARA